ncbi:PREDICTED: uncharacterized protein LOC107173093 [Diuraphis noxia]|uniref:uncharacterized protein LOC107173093 n=1 Tax=Diuraphis noxia TaxID=143948 RepID=UPI0007637017|nr:PREDICTED: uncharacterized protein LOC107173093 [Diuraphis noxia]
MKFLVAMAVYCVLSAAAVHSAPTPGFISPVILPKVHVASPDVTVVKQPYVVQQAEPVFRHVYYAGDSVPMAAVPYVSHHHVQTYHQQPAVLAAYHTAPAYAPAAVSYVV